MHKKLRVHLDTQHVNINTATKILTRTIPHLNLDDRSRRVHLQIATGWSLLQNRGQLLVRFGPVPIVLYSIVPTFGPVNWSRTDIYIADSCSTISHQKSLVEREGFSLVN